MLESQKKGIRILESLHNSKFQYRIESYGTGLSELTILAYKSGYDARCYRITFQTTLYIQASTNWNKADFQLASPARFDKFAIALGLSALQKEQLLLFIATPSDRPEILVLCHTVFVSQEIPLP
ncbi:MAG: hypothetical protein K8R89_09855 [Anaerolineae bacterium]|nr:hypothetical protein [Anaerolineae bacterium]